MHHKMNPLLKFRPQFTLPQIKHILALTGINETPRDIEIRKILVPMVAKIEVGAINPSYKLSETKIIKDAERNERERYENDLKSQEEIVAYENKILGV